MAGPANEDSQAGAADAREVGDIRDLVTFRLALLAATSDRVGQAWLKSDYGLSILMWRVLGIVTAMAPIRFGDVGRVLQLDKGQLSRLVKSLIEQKLIESRTDPADQRVTILKPSGKGRKLHRQILEGAAQRNERVLSALTPEEADTLLRLLDKLQPFLERRADAEEQRIGPAPGRGPAKTEAIEGNGGPS